MQFDVKIDGLDRIERALPAVRESIAAEVKKGLFASAQKVEREAKQSILDGNKSGRIYRRRTVTHRASAPGEAPASDTGRLVNSISSGLNTSGNESFVVAGRGTTKYAVMLEFGTRLMAARPFMHPALEKSKDWIRERLAAAVRKGVIRTVR